MSSPAQGGSLQGINWSIERGLVEPGIATPAARELLEAIATRNSMIKHEDSEPRFGLNAYRMRGLDDLTKKDINAPEFAFSSLMLIRNALAPFKDSDLLEDPDVAHYDHAFVNVTAPKGRVRLHRDSEPWSLVFVSLSAQVKARIKHRDEADYSEVLLTPGDALKVVNPAKRKQRPKHEFINLSNFARISYGEYTTQHDR